VGNSNNNDFDLGGSDDVIKPLLLFFMIPSSVSNRQHDIYLGNHLNQQMNRLPISKGKMDRPQQ